MVCLTVFSNCVQLIEIPFRQLSMRSPRRMRALFAFLWMEMHNLRNEWMPGRASCAFNGQQSAGRTSIQTFPFLCLLCCTAIHLPFIRHWIHGTNENRHFIIGARFSNSLCLHYYNSAVRSPVVNPASTTWKRQTRTDVRLSTFNNGMSHDETLDDIHCIQHLQLDIEYVYMSVQSNRFQSKRMIWAYDRWMDDVPTKLFSFYLRQRSMRKWKDDGNGNDENMHIPNATTARVILSQTKWRTKKWLRGRRRRRRGKVKNIVDAKGFPSAQKIRPSLCFRDEDDWWVRGMRDTHSKKNRPRIFESDINPLCTTFLCLFFPFFFQFYYSVIIIIFFVFRFFAFLFHSVSSARSMNAARVLRVWFSVFRHCLRSRRQRRLIHFRLCTVPNGNIPLQRRVNRKKDIR